MSRQKSSWATALLAGGQSTRMGSDKALLDWKGKPLWQAQWEKLSALKPTQLILSCRQEQHLIPENGEVLYDPPGNAGPLPAILRCLESVQTPLLVLAVDMPEMTVAFLDELVHSAVYTSKGNQGIVCRSSRSYEPLCAIYPTGVIPLLSNAISSGELRLQSFVRSAIAQGWLQERMLTKEEEALFLNLNSPTDYPCNHPSPSK